MSDYISRDELLELYAPDPDCDKCSVPFPVVRQNILDMPAADVASVRHGYWEFPIFADNDDELDPRVKCSECGSVEAAFARWKYCPNCGARMDKEAAHES